ncbi:hypothetical protein CYLTODRAFT_427107 [Cylindrobasidium torrendii FP15055 ss-10]|uniref:Uncharacterized protein n=1 Tax=Cylindrobasidium torrendii FP15055 ss-10 TaxID=1314674 RepID=A0A0D7AW14_9AGAR|nr:hypothetical protein CYLTODRAFT_427107 [Cylindrobasidium torrendii FP15055 ss-10]
MGSVYTNLLAHLQRANPIMELDVIQGTLSHHLAHLSPSPTPLAASAVSAPIYLSHPIAQDKLQSLSTAFRHAVHIKYELLRKEAEETSLVKSAFTHSTRTRLAQWLGELIKGLQGGQPIMRLACSTGMLMGVHDFERIREQKGAAENEVVLALAGVMDQYRSFHSPSSDWEREFQPVIDQDGLYIALILSAESLPLVADDKLRVLPLDILGRLLTTALKTAFSSGSFLSTREGLNSPYLPSVAALSKLCSILYGSLISSRPREGLLAAQETLDTFAEICALVESDWQRSQSSDLDQRSWLVLKTLLFSTIMISEGILSNVIYVSKDTASFGRATLSALGHLSFVIQQFGGITPSSNFVELKRAVYLALDVVAGSGDAEHFIASLLKSRSNDLAKKAFILACVEQLVPVLRDPRDMFTLCEEYLNSPKHRETYESAHSVVLAVFARDDMDKWVEKMTPWYMKCLVDNSTEDGLDTMQLSLACSTVVRSAFKLDDGLGWYAIERLEEAIDRYNGDQARAHKLRLALIACVSSVRGLSMLERTLKVVRRVTKGKEEVIALGEEIIGRVGDSEKAFAIEWWAENKPRMEREFVGTEQGSLARL